MLVVRSRRANGRTFVWPMPKWRRQRGKLVRELAKGNIQLQPQVERKWLASLLGDEKAVTPLLKFLKAAGIGKGEGARERAGMGAKKMTEKVKTCLDEFRRRNPQKSH